MTTGMVARQHVPNEYLSDDMTKTAWMLEAVGAGCDEREMYAVNLQMKRLGENPSLKLKHIRFFGKFFGIHQDYYVFEAQPKAHQQQPPETEEGVSWHFHSSNEHQHCDWHCVALAISAHVAKRGDSCPQPFVDVLLA